MDIDTIPCDMYVDISGVDCALPDSKLTDAVSVLEAGKSLLAVCAKELLKTDIVEYCNAMNLNLAERGETEREFYFLIKKGG